LKDGAWLRHAAHANRLGARLTERLRAIPGLRFLSTPQVNSVFLELPPPVIAALRERGWKFYTFIGQGGIRLMCSWDTTTEDVDALAADLAELLAPTAP
ncbi:MAG: threonine aldolase, partial [Planctomycetaceae bacterium]